MQISLQNARQIVRQLSERATYHGLSEAQAASVAITTIEAALDELQALKAPVAPVTPTPAESPSA